MSESNGKKRGGSAKKRAAKATASRRPSIREGGTHLSLYNSGNEVWLYDDANADAIRSTGALNFLEGGETESVESLTKRGLIVGYELQQDDELEVAVYVGAQLTESELSVSRWLEPQTAFLRLPSGTLCVEPNDSLRVGGETPTDEGGLVTVPAGDYRLTLYRVDHEALSREGLEWRGPQEVIVLTPGGSLHDAAEDLLPFEARRDLSWVGKYEIRGNTASALAWFGDYWDTCVLNLDSAAAAKMGMVPGSYIRTTVPAAGITLISAVGASWTDAGRLPPPSGVALDEYGYAALSPMGEWDGAEALFCRRERTKTRIEQEHHDTWVAATVEVLDPETHAPAPPEPSIAGLTPTDLPSKLYFESGFLGLILSDVLPGVDEDDELTLPQAIEILDATLGTMGFAPQGDVEWEEQNILGPTDCACRLYSGQADRFVAVITGAGTIDVLAVSELGDGRWIVTGLADDFESRLMQARDRGVSNEGIEVESIDAALETIMAAHQKSLRGVKQRPVPPGTTLEECAATLKRFLDAAFG